MAARLSLIAHVPNEKPRCVSVSSDLLSLSLAEVAGAVRRALCVAFEFGEEEEESLRILYKERDLDDDGPAAAFQKALRPGGIPCTVRVLFRLLGGKGGFGALLRKAGKNGKKTTNFDAQRDLSGRRLRHSKAVERIKEWMENQKRDDDLVKLITGEGPDLPKAPDPNSMLDPEYVRKLKRAGANKSDIVSAGLQRRLEEDADDMETAKRSRTSGDTASVSSCASGSSGSGGWISALDALGSPSSPASGDSDDDAAAKAKAAGSASSSGPVAGASASGPPAAAEEEEEDDEEADADEEDGDGTAKTGQDEAEKEDEPVKRSRGCRGAKAASESERLAAGSEDVTIARPEDLADYGNAEELVNSVDAEDLKRSLQLFGMKCGGSPRDRAARLFMLKLTPLKDLPKSVLAPKK